MNPQDLLDSKENSESSDSESEHSTISEQSNDSHEAASSSSNKKDKRKTKKKSEKDWFLIVDGIDDNCTKEKISVTLQLLSVDFSGLSLQNSKNITGKQSLKVNFSSSDMKKSALTKFNAEILQAFGAQAVLVPKKKTQKDPKTKKIPKEISKITTSTPEVTPAKTHPEKKPKKESPQQELPTLEVDGVDSNFSEEDISSILGPDRLNIPHQSIKLKKSRTDENWKFMKISFNNAEEFKNAASSSLFTGLISLFGKNSKLMTGLELTKKPKPEKPNVSQQINNKVLLHDLAPAPENKQEKPKEDKKIEIDGVNKQLTKGDIVSIMRLKQTHKMNLFESIRNPNTNYLKVKCEDEKDKAVILKNLFIRGISFLGDEAHIKGDKKQKQTIGDEMQLTKAELLEHLKAAKDLIINSIEKKIQASSKGTLIHKRILSENDFELLKEERITLNDKKLELESQKNEFSTAINKIQQEVVNCPENSANIGEIYKKCEREIFRGKNLLPIYAKKSEIINAVEKNEYVIVIGETGSGKSTQIVQYLLESKLAWGKIACTEPRKIACSSLAERVSKEYLEKKNTVFTAKHETKNEGQVVFATDSAFLNEILEDRLLSKYSCVVVDEVHERSLFTDLVLGFLKECVEMRRKTSTPLHLVVTSATMDQNLFVNFFNNCPVIKASGRMFPVEIKYQKKADNYDYVWNAVEAIKKQLMSQQKQDKMCAANEGDILVFLTGQMEIEQVSGILERTLPEKVKQNTIILPLHGKLEMEDQKKIYKRAYGKRKVILATNIAESSITVDGVTIVIDTGRMKENRFDSIRNINVMEVGYIPQTSAVQRAGRAGRTAPGICIRLYSERDFNRFPIHKTPEIKRVHLGAAILKMKQLGVLDIPKFMFIEAPEKEATYLALQQLEILGAIQSEQSELTEEGKLMANMDTTPIDSKMIFDSKKEGVYYEMSRIIAMRSVSHKIFNGRDNSEIENLKTSFCNEYGDFLSILKIYCDFENATDKENWLKENQISKNAMKMAEKTKGDIDRSFLFNPDETKNLKKPTDINNKELVICRIVFKALMLNIMVRKTTSKEDTSYNVARMNRNVCVDSSSAFALLKKFPICSVFYELNSFGKASVVLLSFVDEKWINEDIPQKFKDSLKIMHILSQTTKKIENIGNSVMTRLFGKRDEKLKFFEEEHKCVIKLDRSSFSMNITASLQKIDELQKKIGEIIEKIKLNTLPEENLVRRIVGNTICEFEKGLVVKTLDLTGKKLKPNELEEEEDENENEDTNQEETDQEDTNQEDDLCVKVIFHPGIREVKITFSNEHEVDDFIYHNKFKNLSKMCKYMSPKKGKKENAVFLKKWLPIISAEQIRNDYLKGYSISPFEDSCYETIYKELISRLNSCGKIKKLLQLPSNGGHSILLVFFNTNKSADAMKKALNLHGIEIEGEKIAFEMSYTEQMSLPNRIYSKISEKIEKWIKTVQETEFTSNFKRIENGNTRKFRFSASRKDILERINESFKIVSSGLEFPMTDSFFRYLQKNIGKKLLQSIETKDSVVLIQNKNGKKIQIYGSDGTNQDDAIKALREIGERLKNQKKATIKLPSRISSLLMKEISAKVSNWEKNGNDETTLIFDRFKKEILVEGNEPHFSSLKKEISEIMSKFEIKGEDEFPQEEVCPVCLCPITNPLMMNCGHKYCLECAQRLVQSSLSDFDFPCKCSAGGCSKHLAIQDIREIADSMGKSTFEKLALGSFKSYVNERSEEFGYCFTQDCEQIFPKNNGSTQFCCDTCKKGYCKKCGEEYHDPKIPCSVAKATLSVEQLIQLDIRQCAHCKESTSKNGGCHHMTCAKCKGHWCWFCGKGFGDGTVAYLHQSECKRDYKWN